MTETTKPRLVGAAEIARMIDVSRARAHQLSREKGFPDPVASLTMGKVWDRSDIEDWGRDVGRLKIAYLHGGELDGTSVVTSIHTTNLVAVDCGQPDKNGDYQNMVRVSYTPIPNDPEQWAMGPYIPDESDDSE